MSYKIPVNVIKASKALCVSIIKSAGGPAAVANSLGWNRQYVHKCVRLGYIPLVQVYSVSKLLDTQKWAISYHKLLEIFGEEAPSLKSVIEGTKLLPAEKARILKFLKKS